MTPFVFSGEIPASKSLYNRALIIKSFYPEIELVGDSTCDDVLKMKEAVRLIGKSNEFDCGEAGTVLRFLALRVSRNSGEFLLRGTPRLLSRPQEQLLFLLEQLGVEATVHSEGLYIKSSGWKKPLVPIKVHRKESSQFASALLLSAWNLSFDLQFEISSTGVSDSYWDMTKQVVTDFGLDIKTKSEGSYFVPSKQNILSSKMVIEQDYSSMFAIAATAALCGKAEFKNVSAQSYQSDHRFMNILKMLNVPVSYDEKSKLLVVQQAGKICNVTVGLKDSPDLFPVLSILCAHAKGESVLFGAPQLIHKESNRIEKTAQLLSEMGVSCEQKPDGVVINSSGSFSKKRMFEFDPDQDHRMAMAAGILLRVGWPVKIKHPECVRKSYPEFWHHLGLVK